MEKFILELNNPANRNSPKEVQDLQRQIQLLQREKSAWQTGLAFLQNENATIRFYGALTLTIKINTDWCDLASAIQCVRYVTECGIREEDGLSENQELRNHLLESLINSYIQLTNLPDASFVLKKICSTLSTFFLKASSDWRRPVCNTLVSMANGVYTVSTDNDEIVTSSWNKITFHQLRGLLWLCSDLAEVVGRRDTGASKISKPVGILAENGEDVWQIIHLCLKTAIENQDGGSVRKYANFFSTADQQNEIILSVLQLAPLWAVSAPSNEPSRGSKYHSMDLPLNQTLGLITVCFHSNALTEPTLQALTTMLQSFSGLMQNFQRASQNAVSSLVTSPRASEICSSLIQGDFSAEGLQYVEFLATILNLDLFTENWWHFNIPRVILSQLRLLMTCPGVPVIEDEVCQRVLEIFNEIIEATTEWPSSKNDTGFKGLIIDICSSSISKAQFPIEEMDSSTSVWDADDRAKFHEFRQDVRDFITYAYFINGNAVPDIAITGIRKADSESNWEAFESYLFSLSALLDDVSAGTREQLDSYVVAVFQSQIWAKTVENMSETPDKARQGAIRFVALNTAYLQRHPDALLPCLNFLFSSLHLNGSTTSASRAIHTFCNSQSPLLVEALPQFISSLRNVSDLEPSDRHRVYGAVAVVIQAVPTEETKLAVLSQMLELMAILLGPDHGPKTEKEALREAVDVLQTLSSIGKGLRAPADTVIDLDGGAEALTTFWTSGEGSVVQRGVLTICMNALQVPGAEGSHEMMESACEFMKSGYTEQHPSPFKFPPEISLDFLASHMTLNSPNIEAVMTCASSFLASTATIELQDNFSRLMVPLITAYETAFSKFQTTGEAPDNGFSSSTFDFFARLLPKWGQTWLALPEAERSLAIVVEVAIIVLNEPDTLPRRSAASLIAAIVEFSGPASHLVAPASTNLATVLYQSSPRMLAVLVRLISGECARSELEALTEPLKKFVIKLGSQLKDILREAMKEDSGVLGSKALASTTLEERIRFVAQVVGLRGARKTNEVVRQFWIDTRGSGFGYVM